MSANQPRSEQLTFWQLINKTKVEIPIIQRDYAQGRIEKEKVRNDFLDALNIAIEKFPIELDFVYGSQKDGIFQPLDGQQRLTTLFLLHWYVATNENFLNNEVKDILTKFTYETRASSREFCTELVTQGILIKKEYEEISVAIKDAQWFFLSWEKDPTIKAMLIMLDAIHARFKDNKHVWGKLIDEINRPITFHYVELKNFGLSDDLYIKMNARGKQLTPFECFKAQFEKKIDDEEWDKGKIIKETFSHQTDTIWTDLFWTHGKEKNKIDLAFIKFIANIAMSTLAVRADKAEYREKKIQELFNNPEDVAPEDFHKESYDYLYRCLNVYCNNSQLPVPTSLPFWQHLSESNTSLFNVLIKTDKPTYQQRVLFYAQTEYLLINKNFDPDFFSNWMRVARNIVHNSTIDSASTFITAINLIKELSRGSNNIYKYLTQNIIISKVASDHQINEEILKAKLISENDDNKTVIFDTEDINFCKGRIGFALYCIDYLKAGDNFDGTKLTKIKIVIQKHLNNQNITNEFRRAFLTIGDNNFYNYWWSWVYVVKAPKRCLIENVNELKNYAYNLNYRHYLKDLLNQITEKEIDKLLRDFIPSHEMPKWKIRLIREPELLDEYCQSHFVAIPDDRNCCYLLRVGRPRDKDSCTIIE